MKVKMILQIIYSWSASEPAVKLLRVYLSKPKYLDPIIPQKFEMQFKGFRRALRG